MVGFQPPDSFPEHKSQKAAAPPESSLQAVRSGCRVKLQTEAAAPYPAHASCSRELHLPVSLRVLGSKARCTLGVVVHAGR